MNQNTETKIRTFRDLDAWKESHKLVLQVYEVTKKFPKDELFALVGQMRRCAVSITSNIAEGFSRNSYKEKIQFFSISQGSVTELQSQLDISKDVGYLSSDEYVSIENQSERVHKIINGLIKSSRTFLLLVLFLIPNSIFLIPESASAALTDGLTGYWTFNSADVINNVGDLSGLGNHAYLSATIATSTALVAGKRGQALQLDGVDDMASTSGALSTFFTNSAATISVWYYPTGTAVSHPINSYRGDAIVGDPGGFIGLYRTNIGGTDRIWAYNWDTEEDRVGATYTVNQWIHLTLVHGGGTLYLYKNGELVGTDPSGNTFTMTGILTMGRGYSVPNEFLQGKIDDVRVYNRALAAEEVKQLYLRGTALGRPPNNLGLVGYWSFDEGTSTRATDFSGNGKSGTLSTFSSNLPLWTSGKRGEALSFSNSDDYVNLGDNFDLNTGFTVCAWARPTDIGNQGYIGGKFDAGTSNGWFIRQFGTDWRMGGDSNTLLSATLVQLNTWQHLCFVGNTNPGTSIEYVNGVNAAETTLLPTLDDNAQNATIGDRYDNARNFSGDIDEVRIYSRVLSPSEITALYRSGAVRFTSSSVELQQGSTLANGLVGHWTFDGGDTNWTSLTTGTTSDRSGQGNHGTLTNMEISSAPIRGVLGQAFDFSAAADVVSLGDVLDLAGSSMSLCGWIKPTDAAGIGYLAGKFSFDTQNGWFIRQESANWRFGTDGANFVIASNAVELNQWQHLCLVTNPSPATTYGYKNGVEVGTSNTSPALVDNAFAATIGDSYSGLRPFTGFIDDVRIYDRALTVEEVKQLYRLGRATIKP